MATYAARVSNRPTFPIFIASQFWHTDSMVVNKRTLTANPEGVAIMNRFLTMVLVFSIVMPSQPLWSEEETPAPATEAAPEPQGTVTTFTDALFEQPLNLKQGSTQEFFCSDKKENVSSNEAATLLERYLFFFHRANTAKSVYNDGICALYYRERYARNLFEIPLDADAATRNPITLERRYLDQLEILRKLQDKESKAISDLIYVVQEYWLTRFITFVYHEKSQEFVKNYIGGSALALGAVASLIYFKAPKFVDIAAKAPRLIFNLGMLARRALFMVPVGTGLGAVNSATSDAESKAMAIWPSPLTILKLPDDQATIDAQNMEKNSLLKEAFGIGGSVVAGYVGWGLLETAIEKEMGSQFIDAFRKCGKLTLDTFMETLKVALARLRLESTLKRAVFLLRFIEDSELMGMLATAYEKTHGTATIGSLIITDVLLHFAKKWIHESITEGLKQEFSELKEQFRLAIADVKTHPHNPEKNREVFRLAQEMFEAIRLLTSHLLLPSYQTVAEFVDDYAATQTVPMTCRLAGLKVPSSDDDLINNFLEKLQTEEKDSYFEIAEHFENFKTLLAETQLEFFIKFFDHKLALLKMSFFFDERYGLSMSELSKKGDIKEFGQGYVKAIRGELAVNQEKLGRRLAEAISKAKTLASPNPTPKGILEKLLDEENGGDYLNAQLYRQCRDPLSIN